MIVIFQYLYTRSLEKEINRINKRLLFVYEVISKIVKGEIK